jgi:AraC-like DNA-binding protein
LVALNLSVDEKLLRTIVDESASTFGREFKKIVGASICDFMLQRKKMYSFFSLRFSF